MRVFVCLIPLCLAAQLTGQTATAATITAGNISYTQGALPTSATSVPTAGDDLNAGGGDVLTQHYWLFRVVGDLRQYTFARDTNATRVVNNPSMVTTWPDANARGVISASLTQTVTSTGTSSGYLREDLIITNISAAPIMVDLFAYTDFEVGGTSNVARGDLNSQVVQNATTPVLSAEFFGIGNTGAAVIAAPTLANSLTGSIVYDLPGWSGTFDPGDYSGAMQWSGLPLAPNQSVTVVDYLAIHSVRPQLVNYGTGIAGSNGLPVIGASEYFVQDGLTPRSAAWTVDHGVPSFIAALVVNFSQGSSTLAGLQVQVALNGAVVVITTLDHQGKGSVPLTVPPTPSFSGMILYGQWFVADGTTPNGIASYSGGLQAVLGHW